MRFSHIKLKNWRNFGEVDCDLPERAFIVGPNASGKSNFLDVFRFLRDIASMGLEYAVEERDGFHKIRSLHATRNPDVEIEVDISDKKTKWKYRISIEKVKGGSKPRNPVQIKSEIIKKDGKEILRRPNKDDIDDPAQKKQSYLTLLTANKEFRPIVNFLKEVSYTHFLPQIIRNPELFPFPQGNDDTFGWRLIENVTKEKKPDIESRLRKISEALQIIVPQLKDLNLTEPDVRGRRHLECRFKHWRYGKVSKQNEKDFSDGTLRMIGLFWMLLEGKGLLLMEEPELYLHSSVIKKLPYLFYKVSHLQENRRQMIISTHSLELVQNQNGVQAEEILLVKPTQNGSRLIPLPKIPAIRALLEADLDYASIIEVETKPPEIDTQELHLPLTR